MTESPPPTTEDGWGAGLSSSHMNEVREQGFQAEGLVSEKALRQE